MRYDISHFITYIKAILTSVQCDNTFKDRMVGLGDGAA